MMKGNKNYIYQLERPGQTTLSSVVLASVTRTGVMLRTRIHLQPLSPPSMASVSGKPELSESRAGELEKPESPSKIKSQRSLLSV